jgi:hypothetical protein
VLDRLGHGSRANVDFQELGKKLKKIVAKRGGE